MGTRTTILVEVLETIAAVVPLKATRLARPRLAPVIVTFAPTAAVAGVKPVISGVTDAPSRPITLFCWACSLDHSVGTGRDLRQRRVGTDPRVPLTFPEVVIRPIEPSLVNE